MMPDNFIGQFDTKTDGKTFAIGVVPSNKGFVLNMRNGSFLLLAEGATIDLKKFNFDEFDYIEINGNKFVRERNND